MLGFGFCMIPSHDDDIYNRCDIYGRFIGEERAIKICLMFMMMEVVSQVYRRGKRHQEEVVLRADAEV